MDATFILVFYAAATVPILDGRGLRESVLHGRHLRWTILSLVAILVMLAFYFRNNVDLNKIAVLAGIAPLVHLLIYLIGCKIFYRAFGRIPADTAFNVKKGLLWDRLFAVLVLLGPAVPIMIILFNIAK